MTFSGHHRRAVIGVADRPRQLPLIVVAERERDEVFAAWLVSLRIFLLLVAGLALLVGAVAYWMGRSIVAPLNRLIAATDGIARGELDVQLPGNATGEIGRLTKVFNMMAERLRRGSVEVESARRALEEKNRQLELLAVTDGLTGLYNRKKLDEILADQFARFRRHRRPFALLMLDLDNFKSINDSYGHVAGDEVLKMVAATLRQSVRTVDYVARYGGEEFVVVLVETPLGAALEVAERIRAVVQVRRSNAGSATIPITVSLGVAHSREGDDDPEKIAVPRGPRALRGQARRTQPGAIRDVTRADGPDRSPAASARQRAPSFECSIQPDRPPSVSTRSHPPLYARATTGAPFFTDPATAALRRGSRRSGPSTDARNGIDACSSTSPDAGARDLAWP